MKIFIIIVFILNLGVVYSQENDSIKWTKVTCEKGTEEAKIDFEKGNYNCYSYGLIFTTESSEFIKFLQDYRKRKYGIVAKNAGCVITDYSKCYSKTMEELVFKKFGSDIFEKSRKEAEELFKHK